MQLLNVGERTIRNIVSKAKPPYDFEMTTIGEYENEKERLKLKFAQFKSKYYNMIGPRAKAFCSIFFIHFNENDALELLMSRTKSKHLASE